MTFDQNICMSSWVKYFKYLWCNILQLQGRSYLQFSVQQVGKSPCVSCNNVDLMNDLERSGALDHRDGVPSVSRSS